MELDQTTAAWISGERFASFLERSNSDRVLAVELYLWHARIAGASLTTLHHFEVALRNAVGAGLRREILEPLTNLHLLRNRIAHHDSLLDQNLERRLAEMVEVASVIDPACGQWLTAHTDMPALLAQRPGAE